MVYLDNILIYLDDEVKYKVYIKKVLEITERGLISRY